MKSLLHCCCRLYPQLSTLFRSKFKLLLSPSEPLWPSLNPYDPIWTHLNLSKLIWAFLCPSITIWTNTNPSQPIWTHLKSSQPSWSRPNPSESMWEHLNPYKPIQTYLSLSFTRNKLPGMSFMSLSCSVFIASSISSFLCCCCLVFHWDTTGTFVSLARFVSLRHRHQVEFVFVL